MEKNIPLGLVVARRTLVDAVTERKVALSVGIPRLVGDGWDWVCPFEIKGIGKTIRGHAHGIDALQALQLVGPAIRGALESTGRTLTFLGDPYWQSGFPKLIIDLGIPALGRHLERLMIAEQGLWVKGHKGRQGASLRARRLRAKSRRR